MLHLTIGNWIAVGCILMACLVVSLLFGLAICESKKVFITSLILSFIIIVASIFGLSWYNTSTAQGMRNYKDFQSNMENGIDREITITAEDGREIFHYEGKIDVETDHTDNYIKFESEDGKRYIIMYGITDTITIIEK